MRARARYLLMLPNHVYELVLRAPCLLPLPNLHALLFDVVWAAERRNHVPSHPPFTLQFPRLRHRFTALFLDRTIADEPPDNSVVRTDELYPVCSDVRPPRFPQVGLLRVNMHLPPVVTLLQLHIDAETRSVYLMQDGLELYVSLNLPDVSEEARLSDIHPIGAKLRQDLFLVVLD